MVCGVEARCKRGGRAWRKGRVTVASAVVILAVVPFFAALFDVSTIGAVLLGQCTGCETLALVSIIEFDFADQCRPLSAASPKSSNPDRTSNTSDHTLTVHNGIVLTNQPIQPHTQPGIGSENIGIANRRRYGTFRPDLFVIGHICQSNR